MPIINDEEFLRWEEGVPHSLRDDLLWSFNAYRVALYVLDLAKTDVSVLRAADCPTHQVDQLSRAVASISANVAEGLGRPTAADRARFFAIAVGSLREAIVWYRAVEESLPLGVAVCRYEQLVELRRILIGAQKWLAGKGKGNRMA